MTSTVSVNGREHAPLIHLDRISKSFLEAGRERVVLHEVSAAFDPGEFVVLIGKSGSGKSTLLNLVSGIDMPTSGEVWVAGQALTQLSEHKRTLFRRRNIGFMNMYRWAVHVAGFRAWRDQACMECDVVPADPAMRR